MDEIIKRFDHHPPRSEATASDHQTVRALLRQDAMWMEKSLPAGREKSLALTKLEEAMFWANAAIARNQA